MRLLRDPYLESAALMAGPLDGGLGEDRRLEMDQVMMPFRNIRWVFDFEEGGGWRKVAE
jgi:hypothetical protein